MNYHSQTSNLNFDEIKNCVINNIKMDINEKCKNNKLFECPCGKTKKIFIHLYPDKIEAEFIENRIEKQGNIEKEHSTKVKLDLELLYSPQVYYKDLSGLRDIIQCCDSLLDNDELDPTGCILHSYIKHRFNTKIGKIIEEFEEYACIQGLGKQGEFHSEFLLM